MEVDHELVPRVLLGSGGESLYCRCRPSDLAGASLSLALMAVHLALVALQGGCPGHEEPVVG